MHGGKKPALNGVTLTAGLWCNCGHPTALHPWALYNPDGKMILTGAAGEHKNPEYGTAWNNLADAVAYVSDNLTR